jgi:hypothetical protein
MGEIKTVQPASYPDPVHVVLSGVWNAMREPSPRRLVRIRIGLYFAWLHVDGCWIAMVAAVGERVKSSDAVGAAWHCGLRAVEHGVWPHLGLEHSRSFGTPDYFLVCLAQ